MSSTADSERDASCGESGQNSPTSSDHTSDGKSRYHPRQLTAAHALEIFKLRPQLKGPRRRGAMMQCKAIAPRFGISPKTVREIWAGRAWARATRTEWTEEEVATRASSISLSMRDDSAAGLHHSHFSPLAPPSHQQDPTLQATPLLGLNTGAVPSLQALLAAAYAPQQASLQPAPPQAHTTSTAQLLAQLSSFQTAAPHAAWSSGAAPPVPAKDLESSIRCLQATLAQLLAKSQAQQHEQQHHQHHFLQLQQHHAIERAVAAVGGLKAQQPLATGLLPSSGGMLPTNLSLNHLAWRPS